MNDCGGCGGVYLELDLHFELDVLACHGVDSAVLVLAGRSERRGLAILDVHSFFSLCGGGSVDAGWRSDFGGDFEFARVLRMTWVSEKVVGFVRANCRMFSRSDGELSCDCFVDVVQSLL